MDCVIILSHVNVNNRETRRVREVVEIVNISLNGSTLINTPFLWDPRKDSFYFKKQSKVLEKISVKKGVPIEELQKEFVTRSKLLYTLYQKRIFGFDEVGRIINNYHKNPSKVISDYNIQV